jgi:hypothetical protein
MALSKVCRTITCPLPSTPISCAACLRSSLPITWHRCWAGVQTGGNQFLTAELISRRKEKLTLLVGDQEMSLSEYMSRTTGPLSGTTTEVSPNPDPKPNPNPYPNPNPSPNPKPNPNPNPNPNQVGAPPIQVPSLRSLALSVWCLHYKSICAGHYLLADHDHPERRPPLDARVAHATTHCDIHSRYVQPPAPPS